MRYSLDPPTYLDGKPTSCHWCGNGLANLRNVYKGRSCLRFYCGPDCCQKGEQRAAHAQLVRTARAAGMVHSHWLATLAAALSVLMLAFIVTGGHKAWAHNPDTHQADDLGNAYSEAYGKCCIGDDYHKLRIEEWEPTEKGWRIRWHGEWLEVPRNAKVKNMRNPDGDAKAWVFGEPDTIYVRCFMPGALT